ncbi:drug/metabolite transporter (DMT)-like permease [Rhizobium azooxidifex]|uniref:Drug/metabolite transporter (DMT)-like permease n=2 Tax=Mycoplana azooxidifex TaxID=1636188 RepID=A0A7W6DHZ7_9HYPH|nr:drug/metabolite transporter (DMT)-like permease [Mycoplana azooxidifex]
MTIGWQRPNAGAFDPARQSAALMTLDRIAPALFVLLWSSGWVAAKYGGIYSDPLTFLVVRYITAALLFAAVCWVAGVRWPKGRSAIVHAMISGAFLHGFYLGTVWWAIAHGVPAALSGIIAALQPLMTALAAPYFIGERLSPLQKSGICLGFAGVAIAVVPKLLGTGQSEIPVFPVIMNVIGMVSVTYGTIYQKQHLQTGDLRAIATLQYVGAAAVTLPFALALEPFRVELSFGFIALLLWSVVGISMGAILLLLYLLRRGQVSRAAALIYLVPPLASVQAAIIFGEELTLPMILGTLVVIAGVYLANRKQRQAAPAE